MSHVSKDTPEESHSRHSRTWVAHAVLVTLFGAMLLPEWFPDLAVGAVVLGYMITLALTVLGLFAMAVGLPAGLVLPKSGTNAARARRWWRFAIVGLLSFALIAMALIHIRDGLPMGSHISKFDAASWAFPGPSPHEPPSPRERVTPRQKMLGDLVARVLPSRTRTEIVALLGAPEERAEFTELCYPLGRARGRVFASVGESLSGSLGEYLIVHFDRHGRFSHATVHVD